MVERKRPLVPDIAGVVKGGEFQKGKIELTREIWASRRRISWPDRKGDLFIIAKEAEDYLALPTLGLPEIPAESLSSWVPRVEPVTGAVFTSRWQKVKGPLDSQEYSIIGGEKSNLVTGLEKRAKSWEVVRLIPQRLEGGLEAAIRQQDEISHDTKAGKGTEHLRIEGALSEILSITQEFVNGDIDRNRLERMSKETEGRLKAEGLLLGSDEIWKRVADYTMRAAKVDSLGRVNPMISRILARAAYLQVTERELILRETKHKASRLVKYLSLVRSCTRIRLESAAETLARIGGFGKYRGHQVFREGKREIEVKEAWEIGQILKIVSRELLGPIQAAPYLLPSAFAEVALTGAFDKERAEYEELQDILNYGGMSAEISRNSAEEYLRRQSPSQAEQRIKHAYTFLKSVLKDPDHQEISVFD